jgi:hypothetical protein
VILIDGQVMSTGLYPSRAQLAQKLGLSVSQKVGAGETAAPATQSCCSPKSGCC